MKRVLPLFLAVCIILSYHYDVDAASVTQFILRAQSSVDADTSTVVGNTLDSTVFPDNDAAYNGQGINYVTQMQTCLADFDFSVLDDYDYYVVGARWSSGSGLSEWWRLYVTAFNSDLSPFVMSNDYNGSHFSVYCFGSQAANVGVQYECGFSSNDMTSWNNGDTFSFNDTSGLNLNGYAYNTVGYYVLDSNIPVYSQHEANDLKPVDANVYAWACSGGISSLTDIFSGTYGYDASGNLVPGGSAPAVIESNENHMYFKDADLGFCIPKNMTNFNSFGGAYVYCRYVVDDWVVNHISDYKVVVSMNSIVGGRQFGSSVTLPLDRDGCVTIPFNAFSTNEIVGFTAYINKTVIEQDFYKTFLYSLSNQQLQVMYQKKSFSQGWSDFVTGGSSNPLLAVVSPSNTEFISGLSDIATAVTQRFDPYKIRLQCYLIDNSENESGTVARMFDLVTGNDDAVDNSGLTNDNPFEPDVDDPEYVPTVPGDNTTYPQIIINNGGSWTGNLDGVISFDPGYRELKQDIDADPDGNFTQYLAPFENNDAGGFIMGFINGMPSAMKTIFISGFGVLTLLGIYRFIRRG